MFCEVLNIFIHGLMSWKSTHIWHLKWLSYDPKETNGKPVRNDKKGPLFRQVSPSRTGRQTDRTCTQTKGHLSFWGRVACRRLLHVAILSLHFTTHPQSPSSWMNRGSVALANAPSNARPGKSHQHHDGRAPSRTGTGAPRAPILWKIRLEADGKKTKLRTQSGNTQRGRFFTCQHNPPPTRAPSHHLSLYASIRK